MRLEKLEPQYWKIHYPCLFIIQQHLIKVLLLPSIWREREYKLLNKQEKYIISCFHLFVCCVCSVKSWFSAFCRVCLRSTACVTSYIRDWHYHSVAIPLSFLQYERNFWEFYIIFLNVSQLWGQRKWSTQHNSFSEAVLYLFHSFALLYTY